MTRAHKKSVRAMRHGALDLIVGNTRRSGRKRAFCRPEGLGDMRIVLAVHAEDALEYLYIYTMEVEERMAS